MTPPLMAATPPAAVAQAPVAGVPTPAAQPVAAGAVDPLQPATSAAGAASSDGFSQALAALMGGAAPAPLMPALDDSGQPITPAPAADDGDIEGLGDDGGDDDDESAAPASLNTVVGLPWIPGLPPSAFQLAQARASNTAGNASTAGTPAVGAAEGPQGPTGNVAPTTLLSPALQVAQTALPSGPAIGLPLKSAAPSHSDAHANALASLGETGGPTQGDNAPPAVASLPQLAKLMPRDSQADLLASRIDDPGQALAVSPARTDSDTQGTDASLLKLAEGQPKQWRQPLQDALGERLQVSLKRGHEQALIRLDPPMMGRIEILIRHEANGAIQVHLNASHPDVAQQLQTIGESLRQELATRQGGDVNVSVGQDRRDAEGRQRDGRDEQTPQQPGMALAEAEAGQDGLPTSFKTLHTSVQ